MMGTQPIPDSRLDRMIARLLTQRACLAEAAAAVAGMSGVIFEIGLGKGRTYTHMRGLFVDREIWVFDSFQHAPAGARPPPERLILGDLRRTLPGCIAKVGSLPVLVHADIGSECPQADRELASFLAGTLAQMMPKGAVLLGDRAFDAPGLGPVSLPQVELPQGMKPWPYYMYRTGPV